MASSKTHPLQFGSLSTFMESASAWVGEELSLRLPDQEPRQFLYGPARDYPTRGGKRFRPALLLLATAMQGGDPARALPSALALELFQNFALVHDDIEDDSQLRRGRPTLHLMHGIPLAINVGDFLLGLVYEVLAENEALLGPQEAWAVQRLFMRVFRETFEGQAMDIGWVAANSLPSRADFQRMIAKKTGWYTGRGPLTIGARLGGAPEPVAQALGDFGQAMGIGFQIRDDLLNLAPDSSDVAPSSLAGGYGKERGGDIAEGKRTLIVIEMLERLPQSEGARLREILIKPAAQTRPEEIEWAINRATETGALEAVRSHCHQLGLQALAMLEPLPSTPQKSILEHLARHLVLERNS